MRIQIDINIPDHLTKARALEIIHDGLQAYIGNSRRPANMIDEKTILEALGLGAALERNKEASDKRRLKGIGIG